VLFLEGINYIEHYGLQRKQDKDGKYSQVTPSHSWNAAQRISNYFLLKLQRHSDHHAHAGRRYQVLRSFPNSPNMPFGYSMMVLTAFFPPIFFYLMDHRVIEYQKKIKEYEEKGLELFPELKKDVLQK